MEDVQIGEIIMSSTIDETSKIVEEYFGTQKDPHQITTSPENRNWIYKNIKYYLNIIKHKDKIIGFSFMLPATKELMDKFISKKISEAELFEKIKISNVPQIPEAIYLCSAVIKKEFRGKGLATQASIKLINKFIDNSRQKPILFYWAWSNEGEKLAIKMAKLTNLELKYRK